MGEFTFTDRDFDRVSKLIGERTGIVLTSAKRQMVYSRLVRRLRALGLDDFTTYLRYVKEDADGELVNFTNALTTNLTAFFREPHHFDYLAREALPRIMKANADRRQLRIWSAGCSTGEEPYTIAQVVREVIPQSAGWDIQILATDLDSNVLQTAANGVYTEERVAGISQQRLRRWFMRGKGNTTGRVRVKSELRDLITFQRLNLMDSWPLKGPFDLIFCRNVVIYFSKDTQRKLVNRYADLMSPEANLFLGHSESLFKVSDRFKLIGNTIYQKTH
ncbi:MAG: protein-glutamate O-methyltransferase [Chromatiales bacterium]|nr:protein-glutamate O-methyltransferase [Chromatiales bacterium]